ncbi:hypothetical protein K2173_008602 [Erythroxylum novogranatense]|uniref:DUF7963 domain-containing protein n=1 Tax=Erythroxylum novogranatense TaxID=1862640 RepID=A0AAV8SKT6_9ROSI|nr:hypothetical protein K2173_008602 [Erythroxylum novogranatense]
MASTSSTPTDPSSFMPEDPVVRAVSRRYEGLVAIRTKAIKGKGAWYWIHLEPILVKNPDTDLPKAVKLKCLLCDAVFSASNPSRTASEHLKRGACSNFLAVGKLNSVVSPLPISSLPSPGSTNLRKRSSHMVTPINSVALVEPVRFCNELGYSSSGSTQQQHLMLSGGKDDLGALAMLEDSVKKLKSPKTSPGPSLNTNQIESALELLTDWYYEVFGSVSFSSLKHPKFRAFLNQVGLPSLSRRDFCGARLDSRFHEAKTDAETRIREAIFFQIASNGWKSNNCCGGGCENLVNFSINLPNGTSVYQKSVLVDRRSLSSKHAEEILWEAVAGVCGSGLRRCVGIVSDEDCQSKALRNIEIQYQWMVNLPCQVQGFIGLINDFSKEFPLFKTVTENCFKLANFVNNKSQFRRSFQRFRMQELECSSLLRVPLSRCDCRNDFLPVYLMLEDVLSCAGVLQMVAIDEPCKLVSSEDSVANEVVGLIQDDRFWKDLEAAYTLVKLIREMAQELEVEKPLIGQCLPLWEDMKAKVKDWCGRFHISEEPVEKIVENRFRNNYHPAWSAAFILDPLNLVRDTTGKYLPPFKCLTQEHEKDVDKLITRLVSREEAHVALMELMKWRSEGLDPLYAQAVQVKQLDPSSGKMKVANPQGSRLVWETCLNDYKTLGKVAVRLVFLHATSCGFKCHWSSLKRVRHSRHSRVGLERAQKMMFIAAHAKQQRLDFSDEEEKDGEPFRMACLEDDMLNQEFSDVSPLNVLKQIGLVGLTVKTLNESTFSSVLNF